MRYVFATILILTVPAFGQSDEDIIKGYRICQEHSRKPDLAAGENARPGPFWQSGWESCTKVLELYKKTYAGIQERLAAEKERQDKEHLDSLINK